MGVAGSSTATASMEVDINSFNTSFEFVAVYELKVEFNILVAFQGNSRSINILQFGAIQIAPILWARLETEFLARFESA